MTRQAIQNATILESIQFASTLLICWGAESLVFRATRVRKLTRARINVGLVVLALPVQAAMSAFCVALASWVAVHQWGLLYLVPRHDNPLIKYGLMFVLLDFLDYVYHYAMHHIPLFWRLHLVHHTDRAMDASTTVREHPGETVLRNAFLILWVFLSGAPLAILFVRQG